jgi:citrate synthase
MSTPPANPNLIHTRIWHEEPEPDNPFGTRTAHCHGYDVYGAMLGHAGWADMLYLLLRGEAPAAHQARLLDTLAVALANPGPRDASVHAAMCGGVGGSTAAATLMAALAVGAGGHAGAREVFRAMQDWQACACDLPAWQARLATPPDTRASIWPVQEHAAGFDPHGCSTTTIVRQALAALAAIAAGGAAVSSGSALAWLHTHLAAMETAARCPLAMSGVAAAALYELGFTPPQGEMLFLLLRLPGAAAHALEQGDAGFRQFPFYTVTARP